MRLTVTMALVNAMVIRIVVAFMAWMTIVVPMLKPIMIGIY